MAAPFSSSPYLQPGPTAVSALLTYAALSPLAPIGSTRYIELGLLLALIFLPLGFLLAPLPRSVLAAIVIVTVAGLIRLLPLFRLARLSMPQFLVASTTLVLTVALAPHVERARRA